MSERPAVIAEDLTRVFVSHDRAPGMAGAVMSLFSRRKKIVVAADHVNLKVEHGELVGFLGPNGAGKTTTLKMLSGILFPSSGRAEVLGYRPWERRAEFQKQFSLVMGQKNQLWWDLPVEESFLLLKELYEIPAADYRARVKQMSAMLEIEHLMSTQVRKLSLGERMKCELVAALLHRPKVVFLDEPTIGLDVVSQKRIREFVKTTNRQYGSTILLTSHYMDDVRALADRVVIIDHGHVIFDDTLDHLVLSHTDTKRFRLTLGQPVAAADLAKFGVVVSCGDVQAELDVPRAKVLRVASAMLARLPVEDIAIADPDVEDVVRDIFLRKPGLAGTEAAPGESA